MSESIRLCKLCIKTSFVKESEQFSTSLEIQQEGTLHAHTDLAILTLSVEMCRHNFCCRWWWCIVEVL